MKKLEQLSTGDINSMLEHLEYPKTLLEDILRSGLSDELQKRTSRDGVGAEEEPRFSETEEKVLDEIQNLDC